MSHDGLCPRFPVKDPNEVELYGFDVTALLGNLEAVTACTFDVELVRGTNDASTLSKVGGADIAFAPIIKQKLQSGTAGCTYRVRATVTTNNGRTFVVSGLLECKKGAC